MSSSPSSATAPTRRTPVNCWTALLEIVFRLTANRQFTRRSTGLHHSTARRGRTSERMDVTSAVDPDAAFRGVAFAGERANKVR